MMKILIFFLIIINNSFSQTPIDSLFKAKAQEFEKMKYYFKQDILQEYETDNIINEIKLIEILKNHGEHMNHIGFRLIYSCSVDLDSNGKVITIKLDKLYKLSSNMGKYEFFIWDYFDTVITSNLYKWTFYVEESKKDALKKGIIEHKLNFPNIELPDKITCTTKFFFICYNLDQSTKNKLNENNLKFLEIR